MREHSITYGVLSRQENMSVRITCMFTQLPFLALVWVVVWEDVVAEALLSQRHFIWLYEKDPDMLSNCFFVCYTSPTCPQAFLS
jgi:hypothetical protein